MDPQSIFGTDDVPPPARRISAGALEIALVPGGIGAVRWGGVEVLRAAQVLVRDTDWGTWPEEDVEDHLAETPGQFRLTRLFRVAGGRVSCRLEVAATVDPGAAELALDLVIEPAVLLATNRAGFVVLHPAGVSGSPLSVREASGRIVSGAFPRTISPSQPFRGVAGLAWDTGQVRAELSFTGEVFEMEDQRNWSDGSFKTYCRPLSLPWPYDLEPGDPVRQGMTLRLSGPVPAVAATEPARVMIGQLSGTMPEIFLADEPGWLAVPGLALPVVQGRRLRVDLSIPSALPAPGHLDTPGELELELVLPDEPDAAAAALAALAASGVAPTRVAAVPAAYMASYQPDGVWPAGLRPEQALALAARAFPHAEPMGGVLTFFTELNRYPAAARTGKSVTFGTSAIVHDASDPAVMQTLEALPAIMASAAVLAEGRPLRLGLVAIGMRSNPYGASLARNPDRRRLTMTAEDPRHRAAFGAAFALGAVAATEGTSVRSLCLAATSGPFGLDVLLPGQVAKPSPLVRLINALAADAGRPRHVVSTPPGTAAAASDRTLLLANLGSAPVAADLPGGLALGPYEVRIIDRRSL